MLKMTLLTSAITLAMGTGAALADTVFTANEKTASISVIDSNTDKGGEGSENKTYYLHIEGTVSGGLDLLYAALDRLTSEKKMNAQLIPINPQFQ